MARLARPGVAFLTMMALGAFGTWSLRGQADFRRATAAFCTAANDSGFGGLPRQASDGSVVNGSTTGAIGIVCPIDDLSANMPHDTVLELEVHGRDAVSVAQAGVQACVTFLGSNGSSCGTQWVSGNSFFGEFAAQPDLSKWAAYPTDTFPSAFAYIYVVLPQSGNGNSSVRGWYMYN